MPVPVLPINIVVSLYSYLPIYDCIIKPGLCKCYNSLGTLSLETGVPYWTRVGFNITGTEQQGCYYPWKPATGICIPIGAHPDWHTSCPRWRNTTCYHNTTVSRHLRMHLDSSGEFPHASSHRGLQYSTEHQSPIYSCHFFQFLFPFHLLLTLCRMRSKNGMALCVVKNILFTATYTTVWIIPFDVMR